MGAWIQGDQPQGNQPIPNRKKSIITKSYRWSEAKDQLSDHGMPIETSRLRLIILSFSFVKLRQHDHLNAEYDEVFCSSYLRAKQIINLG